MREFPDISIEKFRKHFLGVHNLPGGDIYDELLAEHLRSDTSIAELDAIITMEELEHTIKASKNNKALQKKKFFSTFKMACLDCYVGEMSSKSCFFFEKRNSHFCLEARKCDKSNLE